MLFRITLIFAVACLRHCNAMFKGQEYPPGCDEVAAQVCEDELLFCQLFTGPSDDPETMCGCASNFFGDCLRQAGCETARQVGELTQHEVYMKVCVDTIMRYDCADTTMCSINCASEGKVDKNEAKIIPFNNFGEYYLRLKFCRSIVDPVRLERYSIVDTGDCKNLEDFQICTRWIPPATFVPVAIPADSYFVEIDSCEQGVNGTFCRTVDPKPSRVYGNRVIWPRSYDVAQTAVSICKTDGKC